VLLKKNSYGLVGEIEEERLLRLQCESDAGDSVSALVGFNRMTGELIEERKQIILNELQSKKLSSLALADILEVSQRTTRRYLSDLLDAGLIIQTGSFGPTVRYSVPANGDKR